MEIVENGGDMCGGEATPVQIVGPCCVAVLEGVGSRVSHRFKVRAFL